jgi:hypothetical protein
VLNPPQFDNSDLSFAVVTPTYPPDLRRCEVLADSLDRVAPEVSHYLIVDRRDRPVFSHLARGKRRIIESEAIVGKWLWRIPGGRGYWLGLKVPPVRGWIIQQIKKIGAVQEIPERTLVFCDSDVAFLRHFDRSDLLVEGKIGLLDVDYVNDNCRRWTIAAARLLGISERNVSYRTYVGHMICWDRNVVKALQDRIEMIAGTDWRVALARTRSFSEYTLYGVFVREVLGYDRVDHAPSAVPLVWGSWGEPMTTDSAIEGLLARVSPDSVAVMIHSKDPNDPALVRRHLERRWNELNRSTAQD